MRLDSDAFPDMGTMPDECAFGVLGADKQYVFGRNRNPHLEWSGLPKGTRSLVLINDDLDVPVKLDTFNKEGSVVAKELPRRSLCHWVLIDLPPDGPGIGAGEFSDGVTIGGKPGPAAARGTRQGLNAYTEWFAGHRDKKMMGNYFGYDGPCPPWNDEVRHRYVFTMYALSVARLPVEGVFAKDDAIRAMGPHVLEQASITGVYALNPALKR